MDEKIIGIDISSSAATGVLVESDDGGRRITAYARTPLAGRELWPCVEETLALIREQADVDDAFCVTALPDSALYYRALPFPFADRKKIEKVLVYELEPLLPFSPHEAIIDFYTGQTTPVANEGRGTIVYVAVAPRERVAAFLDGLAGVGLDPDIITSRATAAATVLAKNKKDACLIEADGEEILAAVIAGGEVQLVRSFVGGVEDKEAIQQTCQRLKQTLLAYEETSGIKPETDTVLAAGTAVQTEAFSEAVRKKLGLTAQLMNVADLPGLLVGGRPDHRWLPGYMEVALCLALLKPTRRPFFNFRRGEFAVPRKWGQHRDALVKTGGLALLVVLIGLAGFFYDIHRIGGKITTIKEKQATVFHACFPEIPATAASLDRMKSEIIRMRQESGVTEEMHRKAACVDILNDISRLIPASIDVVVSRLVVGPDAAVISGETDAFNSVDLIKNRLAEGDFFGAIEISSANMDKTTNRVQFKLKLELL